MKLYVLRATMVEMYDCPDNGYTKICDRYEDVRFAGTPDGLDTMAADLNRGHVGYWSQRMADALRKLHAGYDDQYTYTVYDVSDLMGSN